MYRVTPFSSSPFSLFNVFNELDKDFFSDTMQINSCRTDIRDKGEKYVMESELPGFEKNDINIDIKDSYLVISAERHCENDKTSENDRYIRRERSCSSYKRSFDISDVDSEKINAEYKNGILTIDLPKKKHEEPVTKRLEIK
ncbi:MAG: Hsp20/alpha crystallin family protein [Ruminococcus sp.]|nr:Hsp20/alpha crystallin family protein [Ruminococcus sp.]